MKRWFLASLASVALPLAGLAQDDMYFVPTKANVEKSKRDYGMPRDTYYSGSDRSVDDYNRRGTYVQEIDSAGNDIVDFDAVAGVYPDSLAAESPDDYQLARRMSRFDDYSWSDPYWAGYYAGRSSWYGWYDPWNYGWYDPWYCGWYSPWYYGWHSPWYGCGWHGWYGGVWGGPHYVTLRGGGPAGTQNRAYGVGRIRASHNGGTSAVSNGIADRSRRMASGVRNRNFSASERFGVNRTNTMVRNNTTQRPIQSYSNGSFGGSRSGGGFSGGSRSTGGSGARGGGFGGRR